MSAEKIWVHAETQEGGQVSSITLEMLAKARQLGGTVEAFCSGAAAGDIAGELGEHGAATLYSVGDLGGSLPGPAVASALAAAVAGGNAPDVILFGTTYDGRDIAARLSVKLDVPVVTNIVELDEDLTGHEQIFGGTVNVKTKITADGPRIYLVRPKSFNAEPAGGGAAAMTDLPAGDLGATAAAKVIQHHTQESSGPKLDEADIVVSGGRGLGEAAHYSLVEQLAGKLGGAAGASRAIVDSGWVPYSHQVGQTGKVVKPNLYIACGISGATQHLVGMKGSKNIIAINKDADAPIFSVADLGVVGDVHNVLPKLLEALDGA